MSRRLCCSTLLIVALAPLHAAVSMPAIFGDHMVLQQDATIPVWGWADPNEAVNVTLGTTTVSVVANAERHWRVDLPRQIANDQSQTLVIAATNQLVFKDVVIGDVWLCSGQSNMEWNLGRANQPEALAKANDSKIRLFLVAKKKNLAPDCDVVGTWEICSPETVAKFSAVGYFFARDLRAVHPQPIGLIGCAWGGASAQAWTSIEALDQAPGFPQYADLYRKQVANLPAAKAAFPGKISAFEADKKIWNATIGKTYTAEVKAWQAVADAAIAAGTTAPPKPKPSQPEPVRPLDPDGNQRTPTALYNGMLAPLIPYALKGAIWYQGENNGDLRADAVDYARMLPRMITDWRTRWGQGDFPFILVQLANFRAPPSEPLPVQDNWPWVREAQLKTLALPHTGMAVIIDIGDTNNIHPLDKHDVGKRLAIAARHVAYGEDLVYSGPLYRSMTVEGDAIRLHFDHLGGGLKVDAPPWTPNGKPRPIPTTPTGFIITGSDGVWHWGMARIDGDSIIVTSPQVPKPVAVRYGWADNPACNVYNAEGLPMSPFRTDHD